MLKTTRPRTSPLKCLIVIFCALLISGCVGDMVASYKTKNEKFKWGKAYVWMSKAHGSRADDTEGSGYLLINYVFKKSVLQKGCSVTAKDVYLARLDTGEVLLNKTIVYRDSTPMTLEINEHPRRQIKLHRYPFEYDQYDFPYFLEIEMDFTCSGQTTSHTFSKELEYSMAQPVIWEQ